MPLALAVRGSHFSPGRGSRTTEGCITYAVSRESLIFRVKCWCGPGRRMLQMLCYRGWHLILQGNPSFHCQSDAHRASFWSVGTRRLAGVATALNRACQARGRTSTCCAARGRWGACWWRPRHLNGSGSSWNPGRCTPHRSVLLGAGQQALCQAPELLGSAPRALGPSRRNPLPSPGK